MTVMRRCHAQRLSNNLLHKRPVFVISLRIILRSHFRTMLGRMVILKSFGQRGWAVLTIWERVMKSKDSNNTRTESTNKESVDATTPVTVTTMATIGTATKLRARGLLSDVSRHLPIAILPCGVSTRMLPLLAIRTLAVTDRTLHNTPVERPHLSVRVIMKVINLLRRSCVQPLSSYVMRFLLSLVALLHITLRSHYQIGLTRTVIVMFRKRRAAPTSLLKTNNNIKRLARWKSKGALIVTTVIRATEPTTLICNNYKSQIRRRKRREGISTMIRTTITKK